MRGSPYLIRPAPLRTPPRAAAASSPSDHRGLICTALTKDSCSCFGGILEEGSGKCLQSHFSSSETRTQVSDPTDMRNGCPWKTVEANPVLPC